MYEISIGHEFCAAHALSIIGHRETLHGHNFRVTAVIAGDTLDDDGLLCDFHTVHDQLLELCKPYENANLHDHPPFDKLNPTAEHIAKVIADGLADRLDEALAPAARVHRVTVTEAPGCAATYIRD